MKTFMDRYNHFNYETINCIIEVEKIRRGGNANDNARVAYHVDPLLEGPDGPD